MPISYSVSEGDLVVADGRGTRWRGRPDGCRVACVVQVPTARDAVVLLEDELASPRFSNVLRIDPDGQIQWRAAPPGLADVAPGEAELVGGEDAWVAVRWEKRRGLSANSWSCFYCRLIPDTGAITLAEFTK